MKKTFFLFLIVALLAGSLSLFSPLLASAVDSTPAGSLIKGTTNPTIYYLAEDGKRYVFPNANIFFSWFDSFKTVTVVSDATLASYPLGGNVQYKPGEVLVKVQTDPKVYLVSSNGILRWIKNEAIAKALYGNNWNKLIDDLPDSFFTNYKVGDPVADANTINLTDLIAAYPSISHNFGFKIKQIVKNQIENQTEKQCSQLENAVNNLQKRLARWNMSLGTVGSDFVAQCVEKNITTPKGNKEKDKTTLCHKGDETITVGSPAVKAHLAHGDTLGACTGDEEGDNGRNDKTAPAISAVSSAVTCDAATIIWTTNEAATGKVFYATSSLATATDTKTVANTSLVTSHSFNLTGLTSAAIYYYQVESKDAAGNTATSSQTSFTTLAQCADTVAPVISNVSATASTTYATIAWATNEPSTSKTYYSLNPLASALNILTVENNALVTAHTQELTGLATSTLYYYKVESKDAANNTASSSQSSFTTLP